jgi:hypothetical protein
MARTIAKNLYFLKKVSNSQICDKSNIKYHYTHLFNTLNSDDKLMFLLC